jgi:hypothetical protein
MTELVLRMYHDYGMDLCIMIMSLNTQPRILWLTRIYRRDDEHILKSYMYGAFMKTDP